MRYLQILIQLLYAISGATAFTVAGYLWKNKDNLGAKPLIATNVSVGSWITLLFISTITPQPVNEIAARLLYFPLSTSVASIFAFSLEYTGREEYVTGKTIAALSIHPIIGVILAFVNPGEAYITVIEPTKMGVIENWGILFWIHATYSYTLILTAAALMLRFFIRNNKTVYQGQSMLLLIGILAGVSLNAVYLVGDVVFNTSAVGTVIAMVVFSYAIMKYDLTNITPVAREKIVEHIRDGVIVLNKDDKIINMNDSAKEVLSVNEKCIGRNIHNITEETKLSDSYQSIVDQQNEVTIDYNNKRLRFQHEVMTNDRGEDFGRLLIIEDITEQVEREEKLRQKNEELDQFASTIAHDLRNPLSAAKGYLNTGLKQNNEEMLKEAQEQQERMQEMIEDILKMSKAGDKVNDKKEVELRQTAKQGWKHAETNMNDLEIAFDEEVSLKADKTRLLQIFENLFRNAEDHNKEKITVTIGLLSDDKPVDDDKSIGDNDINGFFIADNGTGIKPTKREKVFEHGHTTSKNGTGFGLSIIKDVVEAHRWEINVTESKTGGAQFEIQDIHSLKFSSK